VIRSDFPDFYSIKTSWVGDLVVNIFEGAKQHLVSYAHAGHTHKAMMHMLSMRIISLCVCSACAPVPYAYAQHGLNGPLLNL
jgi:NADPH-dependent 7-cyano-7-deazaguanine reductase QueF